jgi:SAM-dependent MidA family methyltransferase
MFGERSSDASPVGQSMRFDRFMEAALYGPSGFYQRGQGAGTQRDFLTSPEVGTLFGAVLARRIDAEWDRLGQPDEFTVLEVGAGPGTLARTIFAASPRCGQSLQYILVDRAEGMRALHANHFPAGRVASQAQLPTTPIVGMVIANELLDNVPTRLLSYSAESKSWSERTVGSAANGELRWQSEPITEPITLASTTLALIAAQHPGWFPFQEQASLLVKQLRDLTQRGSLILIDYMRNTTDEFSALEVHEWLRTYRLHERGSNPLLYPGHCDITVDVAADQLVAAVGPPTRWHTQADALHAWGLASVLDDSAAIWARRTSDYDLHALRARSHSTEAPILTDPAGLGGFTVMEWST